AVRSQAGVRYTRAGQFALDARGGLVTSTGAAVLDDRGQPITLTGAGAVQIDGSGAITQGGRAVATLAVVSLANARKEGDTLFSGRPGARPAATLVQQGWLETSSVNPAKAMIDMMVSLRAYESSQRVLHAIDETLGRGIDSAGSVNGS